MIFDLNNKFKKKTHPKPRDLFDNSWSVFSESRLDIWHETNFGGEHIWEKENIWKRGKYVFKKKLLRFNIVCTKKIFDHQSVGIKRRKVWLLAQVECCVYIGINDCNYVEDGYWLIGTALSGMFSN